MLVKARLPELTLLELPVFVPGPLFEKVDELQKVRILVQTGCKQVEMIRHAAVGMQREPMLCANINEFGKRPVASGYVRENGASLRATNRDEIGAAPDVVAVWESRIFVEEGHAGKLASSDGLEKTESRGWAEAQRLHCLRAPCPSVLKPTNFPSLSPSFATSCSKLQINLDK